MHRYLRRKSHALVATPSLTCHALQYQLQLQHMVVLMAQVRDQEGGGQRIIVVQTN